MSERETFGVCHMCGAVPEETCRMMDSMGPCVRPPVSRAAGGDGHEQAWNAVVDVLDEVAPGWSAKWDGTTSIDAAVKAIHRLAAPARPEGVTEGDIENLRHVGRFGGVSPQRGGALLDLADRLEGARG